MTQLLHRINHGPLTDGLRLLPSKMDSLKARKLLLTIGLQESRLTERDQLERGGRNLVLGPALGLWQFEPGGVRGVLNHPSTKGYALDLCAHFGVQPSPDTLWRALKIHDDLAAAVARLNLWWAKDPLPDIDDEQGGWDYYLNCWRPGAVKRDPIGLREKWGRNHRMVLDYLRDL